MTRTTRTVDWLGNTWTARWNESAGTGARVTGDHPREPGGRAIRFEHVELGAQWWPTSIDAAAFDKLDDADLRAMLDIAIMRAKDR